MKKLLTAMMLCVGSVGAFAQNTAEVQAKPAPGEMFRKMDLDGDGKISKAEAAKTDRKRLQDNFDLIDANKDGFLDKAELKAAREKMQQRRKAGGAQ